jgi:dUTP pyrophosphatase
MKPPAPGPDLKQAESTPILYVHKLDERAKIPTRANEHAVGLDVFAFLLTESGRSTSRAIHQRGVTEVRTGLVVRPSLGYYIQVCSRSGLAKRGVVVATAPGIVDPDYSGELIIMLYNGGFETHYVSHEHRIAQLILAPIIRCNVVEEPKLPDPIGRGANGYGSTGL